MSEKKVAVTTPHLLLLRVHTELAVRSAQFWEEGGAPCRCLFFMNCFSPRFFATRAPTRQVADQRPARMPVTFALMTLLLREHNRCCDEMAPEWDPANDEVRLKTCVFAQLFRPLLSMRHVPKVCS